MRRLAGLLGAVLAAVLLPGCSLAWMFEDPPPASPPPPLVTSPPPSSSETPTPTPTQSTGKPYTGKLAKGATCVKLDADQLAEAERIGLVGAAITYPRGAMVKSTGGWWTVAVSTQVHQNSSGYTEDSVPAYAYFVTDSPTLGLRDDPSDTSVLWALSDDAGEAAAKARACVKQIPLPKPKLDPDDPAGYTGKLAKGATCKAVSGKLLDHLQQVGQVGGAITYPQGRMVRANGSWWTVVVATQVNPNGAGLTAENVPRQAYFVTNAPSKKASSTGKTVSFPLNPTKQDKAAAKAKRCLEQAG
ncbi:MAG: hypothetical protein VB080_07500 [Propionicimonas sp.]|uniref:hypothetical protein n=1 Tax=Propionicimonas sp. TaxID=1955623 RepID=UPI002B206DD0|nr:hypothetical protein [Propionicimonas sp.]MEA4944267.1 hypothetical protein [Propionicimonas sp.]